MALATMIPYVRYSERLKAMYEVKLKNVFPSGKYEQICHIYYHFHVIHDSSGKQGHDRMHYICKRCLSKFSDGSDKVLITEEEFCKYIEAKLMGDSDNLFNFPLIRRIRPALLINEIITVQPMAQPSGMIFYMNSMGVDKKCIK